MVEVTEPTGPDTLAVMMLGGDRGHRPPARRHQGAPGEVSSFMVDMCKVCLFDPKTERRIV